MSRRFSYLVFSYQRNQDVLGICCRHMFQAHLQPWAQIQMCCLKFKHQFVLICVLQSAEMRVRVKDFAKGKVKNE